MRPVIFTLLFVAVGASVTNAQLSIVPQIGLENTKTTLRYNDLKSFLPLGSSQLSPQLSLRLDYKFKQQHGPFAEISTSRSAVTYQFSDPETGGNVFKASPADMQLRFQGGYQVSSKPLYFTKPGASAKPAVAAKPSYHRSSASHYYSGGRCGGSVNRSSQQFKSAGSAAQAVKQKEKGWYLAVQPMAGVALTPAMESAIITQPAGAQTRYLYNAGNWNTAFVTGAGFEFGRNVTKKFVISVQYLKGIGNLDSRQLTTTTGAKESVTRISSDVSAWSLKAGIPINLSRKKEIAKPVVVDPPQKSEKKCGEYRSRCNRVI